VTAGTQSRGKLAWGALNHAVTKYHASGIGRCEFA
jgi:hypothetical protein